jgi:hypothetical protein
MLTDKQDRRGECHCARPDDALLQHFLALRLDLVLEELRLPVRAHGHRFGVRQ